MVDKSCAHNPRHGKDNVVQLHPCIPPVVAAYSLEPPRSIVNVFKHENRDCWWVSLTKSQALRIGGSKSTRRTSTLAENNVTRRGIIMTFITIIGVLEVSLMC